MEYQQINNLVGGEGYKRWQTRQYDVIQDQSNGRYNTSTDIKFDTKMLRSKLSNFAEAYVLVTGTIESGTLADNERSHLVFKNCGPFRNCVTKINNTLIEDVESLDVIMPMNNMLEYSQNYAYSSGSDYEFVRDEYSATDDAAGSLSILKHRAVAGSSEVHRTSPGVAANATADPPVAAVTNTELTGVTIKVPLSYLGNFWRSLEIPLINCDVELNLEWSDKCVFGVKTTTANATVHTANVVPAALEASARFKITKTELYVPVVTLSASDNKNLLKI